MSFKTLAPMLRRKGVFEVLLWLGVTLSLLFSVLSISALQIFLFLSILCWGVVLVQGKRKWAAPPAFWPLLAYAGLSLLSSVLSADPATSFRDCRELLLFLILPLTMAAFASLQELRISHRALLVSAAISAGYSLYTFAFRSAPGERITGFMSHPMTQGGLLMLFVCTALAMTLFLKGRIRWVWAAGFILGQLALSLTLTRSAWIGVAFGVFFLLLLWAPKALVLFPVLVALFLALGPKPMRERALSAFSLKDPSNSMRVEYVQAGLKIIKDHPVWGTGPDTASVIYQYPIYGLSDRAKKNVHLHNNLIQIAAERGLPALAAWLTFMAWTFLALWKMCREKDPLLKALSAGALASLAAFFIGGLFEYNFGDSEVISLFLFLISLPFAAKALGSVPGGQRIP